MNKILVLSLTVLLLGFGSIGFCGSSDQGQGQAQGQGQTPETPAPAPAPEAPAPAPENPEPAPAPENPAPAPEDPAPAPAPAPGNPGQDAPSTDPSTQIVNQQLLALVGKDLQLCISALEGKKVNYTNAFPAMGHLNHALSTLKKIEVSKLNKKVLKELSKRISHARFYLVMYDFDETKNRVNMAIEFVGTIAGS